MKKIFGKNSYNWDESEQYNEMFLRTELCHMKDLALCEGWLTMLEVDKILGLSIHKEDLICGWKKGDDVEMTWTRLPRGSYRLEFNCHDIYHDS